MNLLDAMIMKGKVVVVPTGEYDRLRRERDALRKQLEVARMKLIKIVNHSVDGKTTWCEDYWHLKDIAKDALAEIDKLEEK